jgi:hypothetical protein
VFLAVIGVVYNVQYIFNASAEWHRSGSGGVGKGKFSEINLSHTERWKSWGMHGSIGVSGWIWGNRMSLVCLSGFGSAKGLLVVDVNIN